MNKLLLSLFVLGFSFGSGPCLASCGPVLISYIAGTHKNIARGVTTYLLFSLARVSAYLFFGILVSILGRFLVENWMSEFSRYIYLFGGIFIVLIGILMALGNKFEIGLCKFLNKFMLQQDKKSILTLGLIIGLLPCAPLLVIFSYIGLISKSWIQGLLYSLSFGIGTIISPLLLLAAFAGFIPQILLKSKALYSRIFNFSCAIIIIFLGIQLIYRAF